jgi:hypothetical protein
MGREGRRKLSLRQLMSDDSSMRKMNECAFHLSIILV